ncbi:MAG: DUF4968 domain-containing protein [Muribaculaceae bacterium]|nr:DUF4968 domain-containing protein [Muribaculaceae bacterium]
MKVFRGFLLTAAVGCGLGLWPALAGARIGSVNMVPVCARDAAPGSCGKQIKIDIAGGGTLCVTPVTENIFRVTVLPSDATQTYAHSQSAVLEPINLDGKLSVSAGKEGVDISTPTTRLRVDRNSGKISFYDAKGALLLSEQGGVVNRKNDGEISFKANGGGELYYGAGERGHSLMLNGDTLVMYNRQNYGYTEGDPRISQMGITVPYFVSSKGYGVLFDDFTKSQLVLGDTIVYTSPETAGPLSYYFINGEGTIAGATGRYMELTGRQELPPFWSLGYITSKYGYHDQRETLGAIDSLKTRGYPVDGIVLDLYWYGVETDMGRLDWDKKKWPDPKGMLADLKKQGVNLVAITQPYVNKKGAIDNYNYLVENKMTVRDEEGNNHDVTTWVGDAGMIDVSNPRTRDWYWSRYKALTQDGIAGWWGDLGEPEVHPATIRHANGLTAEQYHNVYGNEWSRIIYDGFKKEFPNERLMLLMRGGTAGLQRYNVFPWSTDVSRSWGGFQPQVKIMLNSGLSGLGYMSSDIGGFAVDPAKPTDPELYVRWLQMGTFTPTLRTHAQLKPEPYHYPEQEEISRRFIKMRYEWLPYNYTLAYENASLGWPLARPLDFHGENPGSKYADLTDEYMWGDNVLVAPVMQPKARSRKVVFPAGTWVNYNHPALTYRGGSTAVVKAPLDELPLFVRQGSFIPLYRLPIENVTQYDLSHLTVRYFPSAEKTTYTLFDDDRKSVSSLADGNYVLTVFEGQKTGNTIEIDIATDKNPGVYDWMPNVRVIDMEIVGLNRAPRQVSVNGTKMAKGDWKYNASARTLTVPMRFEGNAELKINL